MNQEQIEKEISNIENEIAKLQQEESRLRENVSLPVYSGDPKHFSKATREVSETLAARTPQLNAIADAINRLRQTLGLRQESLLRVQQRAELAQLKVQQETLENHLIESGRKINEVSDKLDELCSEFKATALEYNSVVSCIGNKQVFPATMNVFLPAAVVTHYADNYVTFRLGTRRPGTAVDFEQKPKPYVPQPTYSNRLCRKNRKAWTVYLPKGANAAVLDWLKIRGLGSGALLCPVHRLGSVTIRPMTSQSVLYTLQKRGKQAGIASFSPHEFRRTFCSDLLDAGVDVFTVQKLAGHSSPVTTAKYDRRGEEAKKKAVEHLETFYPQHRP